jgi:hypothetical protein
MPINITQTIKMKNILFVAACFIFFKVTAQDAPVKFDGKKWEAPYLLDIPKDWRVERFLIPIEFAPSISYTGVEDIRFTPGWSKIATDEYWGYAFLWYLDNSPKFDAKIIEKNLTAYYTGLINVNVDKRKIDSAKLAPVKTSIKKRATENGDITTFEGTVSMADFLTLKPIVVNLLVHIRSCEGQNKTFVFYEVSPKPYSDNVWSRLNQLWANFKCTKN